MPMNTLRELLIRQLDDLHAGERHVHQVLPKLAQAANSTDLGRVLRTHAEQSKARVARLDRVLKDLDAQPRRAETKGMKGLLEDCMKLAEMSRAEPHVRDAALIAVAQHVMHDEIAGYGCARTWAALLGLDKIASDLVSTLQAVRQTDTDLTRIAEKLNKEAIAPVAV